jgi:protein-tyrosine phosphatase
MKILMICLGNICRSPLAEGILKHLIFKNNLTWQVDSAGTANYHVGEPPHKGSIKVAKQNGIDISKQKCRQFKGADFVEFDKIYVMDSSNYIDVKRIAGQQFDANKIDLILNEIDGMKNKNVPDPWYGTYKDFEEVFAMLYNACELIIEKHRPKF